MKTDISRDTFDAQLHYSGVRAQQGRVLVDADLNEQADIVDYRNRTADTDLIGACGVPVGAAGGFAITPPGGASTIFTASKGRIYVDGILVENPTDALNLAAQPEVRSGADVVPATPTSTKTYAIYLDVWEREVTTADATYLADPALPGLDPTTRKKVSWQIRFVETTATTCAAATLAIQNAAATRGLLTVTATPTTTSTDPCLGPAASGYRGTENQFYRVEIHDGGLLSAATWKWSRENAWVVSAVETVTHKGSGVYDIAVTNTGPDDDRGFGEDDHVELYSDLQVLEVDHNGTTPTAWSSPGFLGEVTGVSGNVVTVRVPGNTTMAANLVGNIRIRRWDNVGTIGSSSVTGLPTSTPTTLENGISVEFSVGTTSPPTDFRTGQYWTFSARTETGTILETVDDASPEGPVHHYCVLAFATWTAGPNTWSIKDCRESFLPAGDAPQLVIGGGDGQTGLPGGELTAPLKVFVGRRANEVVRFAVQGLSGALTDALGALPYGPVQDITTNEFGEAVVRWRLQDDLRRRTQQVVASWSGQTILFHATLRDVCAMWVTGFTHSSGGGVNLIKLGTPPDGFSTTPFPPSSQGRSEGSVGNLATTPPAYFEFEIHETITVNDPLLGPKLYWDESSVGVYYESGSTNALSVVQGALAFTTAPVNEAWGRRTRIKFTPANALQPGRCVFHLRPKVFGAHGSTPDPVVRSLIAAPYAVLTCYIT